MLEYDDPLDREIVGIIAASLAIGRVKSILDAVRGVCRRLEEPRRALSESTESRLAGCASGFVYRFYREDHLAGLLIGLKRLIAEHGTLEKSFMQYASEHDDTCLDALDGFVSELYRLATHPPKMISVPSRGSGCKRLLLYLRWMIRNDAVDPGPWRSGRPSTLLVPIDVHMHNIAGRLGITERKSADMKTCLEITEFFRNIAPEDPVRYDFALTRLGIHPDLDYSDLLLA